MTRSGTEPVQLSRQRLDRMLIVLDRLVENRRGVLVDGADPVDVLGDVDPT